MPKIVLFEDDRTHIAINPDAVASISKAKTSIGGVSETLIQLTSGATVYIHNMTVPEVARLLGGIDGEKAPKKEARKKEARKKAPRPQEAPPKEAPRPTGKTKIGNFLSELGALAKDIIEEGQDDEESEDEGEEDAEDEDDGKVIDSSLYTAEEIAYADQKEKDRKEYEARIRKADFDEAAKEIKHASDCSCYSCRYR